MSSPFAPLSGEINFTSEGRPGRLTFERDARRIEIRGRIDAPFGADPFDDCPFRFEVKAMGSFPVVLAEAFALITAEHVEGLRAVLETLAEHDAAPAAVMRKLRAVPRDPPAEAQPPIPEAQSPIPGATSVAYLLALVGPDLTIRRVGPTFERASVHLAEALSARSAVSAILPLLEQAAADGILDAPGLLDAITGTRRCDCGLPLGGPVCTCPDNDAPKPEAST